MISLAASSKEPPEVRIHGGNTLRAKADNLGDISWLELSNEIDDRITIFLPIALCQQLARAINSATNTPSPTTNSTEL